MLIDYSKSIVVNFESFEIPVKCSCCNRNIKNAFILLINENEYYVGTECTKTIEFSKQQEKSMNECKTQFKKELTQFKKLVKTLEYRKSEFNDSLKIVFDKINLGNGLKYIVKIIGPSRFNSNEHYTYDTFVFNTERYLKLKKIN